MRRRNLWLTHSSSLNINFVQTSLLLKYKELICLLRRIFILKLDKKEELAKKRRQKHKFTYLRSLTTSNRKITVSKGFRKHSLTMEHLSTQILTRRSRSKKLLFRKRYSSSTLSGSKVLRYPQSTQFQSKTIRSDP